MCQRPGEQRPAQSCTSLSYGPRPTLNGFPLQPALLSWFVVGLGFWFFHLLSQLRGSEDSFCSSCFFVGSLRFIAQELFLPSLD